MTDLTQRRGLYFEEFEIGQRITTPGRTVTEADIVAFAGLSGDFTSIHTDAAYTAGTVFGQRVAHGLLVMSIASGLSARTGVLEGTVIAFREISEWKFSTPVFIGDTVHAELAVTEKKPMPRLGGGAISLAVDVVKHDGTKVMSGVWNVIFHSKPSS
jgi:acyl dehydratase